MAIGIWAGSEAAKAAAAIWRLDEPKRRCLSLSQAFVPPGLKATLYLGVLFHNEVVIF